MLSIDWKTFIAARLDNTAGNKNTSVFTEAWLPEQIQDQRFQTMTADLDMVLFTADSNKKLLQLQERRRYFVLSGEEVNVPLRHRRNRNSFRSKSIDPHGRM